MKKIILINPFNNKELKIRNDLVIDDDGNTFDFLNEIPRINLFKNYTENFGYQWNKFSDTQLLKQNYEDGIDISSIRLFKQTNWKKNDLKNVNILEAGSGAGRFSKVILEETSANLYSFDSSNAVDANKLNNNLYFNKNFFLTQSDIENIPYPDNSFDKVICFGVLQHTNNFFNSLNYLISKLKPGGEIVIDFYPINGFWTKISAKYFLRPILKRLPSRLLMQLIELSINVFINIYFILLKLKLHILTRFLPICDIKNALPNNLAQDKLREWVILDTFDMFSAKYDNPQKISKVKKYLENSNIKVTFSGFIKIKNMKSAVVRGIKK